MASLIFPPKETLHKAMLLLAFCLFDNLGLEKREEFHFRIDSWITSLSLLWKQLWYFYHGSIRRDRLADQGNLISLIITACISLLYLLTKKKKKKQTLTKRYHRYVTQSQKLLSLKLGNSRLAWVHQIARSQEEIQVTSTDWKLAKTKIKKCHQLWSEQIGLQHL